MSGFFRSKRNPCAGNQNMNVLAPKPEPSVPSALIDDLTDELLKGKDLTADLIRMLSKVLSSYDNKVEILMNASDERAEDTVKAYLALQEEYVDTANFEGATDRTATLNEDIVRDIASVQQTWKHIVDLKNKYVEETKHIEPHIATKLDDISLAMATELGRRKTLYQNFIDAQRELKQSIVVAPTLPERDLRVPRRSLKYPEGDARRGEYVRTRDIEGGFLKPRWRADEEMKAEGQFDRPRRESRESPQKKRESVTSRALIKRPTQSGGLATGFVPSRQDVSEVGDEGRYEGTDERYHDDGSRDRERDREHDRGRDFERDRERRSEKEDFGTRDEQGEINPMKEAGDTVGTNALAKPAKAIDRATSMKNPLPGAEQKEEVEYGDNEPRGRSAWETHENPVVETTDSVGSVLYNKPAKALDRATSLKNPLPGAEQRESPRSRRETYESPYGEGTSHLKNVLIDKPIRAVTRAGMLMNPIPTTTSRGPRVVRGNHGEVSSSSDSDEEYERLVINKYREQLEKRSPQKRVNPETSRTE